jgi:hypothetical protein
MTAGTELIPFDWWFSGRYWYCSLHPIGGKRVSGCGPTKPQAVADARKELTKRRPI